jgi:Pyruvate/2-oxoacid:ferredoxin oxidoreductase delta subunit
VKLEKLAQKGLIYRIQKGDKRLYKAFQFLIGIYEFQLNRMDREFAELFEEYMPWYRKGMKSVRTGQLRTIPLGSAIDISSTDVATYNNVRELIKESEFISVADCICRKEQELLGNKCDYTKEICFGFGDFGRFYVDNGLGRMIDVNEALSLLDVAEEEGLVLKPSNSEKLEFLCCCCACCCASLRLTKTLERPIDRSQTHYVSLVDAELCTACEACLDRCPMDAIRIEEDIAAIIDGRCIGCGVCIPTCPAEAIVLELRPGMEKPPLDFEETTQRIKSERSHSDG